nr:glycosyltransferase family 39 protein [Rhizobium sp. SSA_523]
MGYGGQPPFYNWLQIGTFKLFGLSVASVSLLKNILLFLCCIFYWRAASMLIDDRRLPLVAMLGVLAIPSVTVLAQRDLTHAVANLCLVSIFLCVFIRTIKSPSLTHYVLLGICVGIGAITKYNFVIIPLAAALAVLPEDAFRKRLFDWRILVAGAVAAAITLPHFIWVLMHLDAATTGTVEAMRAGSSGDPVRDTIRGQISILLSALKAGAPVILLFALVFRRSLGTAWRTQTPWTRVIGRMIIACLVLVALIGIGFGASSIREKWLSPFMLLLPLYLTLKLAAAEIDSRDSIARMAPPLLGIITGFVVYLAISNIVAPYFGKYGKEHVPYRTMLEEVISKRSERPAYIISSDLMTAGNIRLQRPDIPVLMPDFVEPIPLSSAQKRGPGLLIWPADGDTMPGSLSTLLESHGISPQSLPVETINVPFNFAQDGDVMRFGYLWLEQAPQAQR